MSKRTVGATIAFCDWMIDKSYGTVSQVNPWKIALKQVFGTVDGAGYEEIDWSELDLDEYLERFHRRAMQDYKTESIVAYGRRVRRATEAHRQYLETGRPPASRPVIKREKPAEKSASASVVPLTPKPHHPLQPQEGMVTFPYPLSDGRMISLTLPPRLKADDVNRITTFIRTLQDDSSERKQLPPRAGENGDEQAA